MQETQPEEKQGWSLQRYLLIGGVALGAIILLPFIIGLVFAIVADPEPTAVRFGMIRDIVIIVLAMQGILIIVALTVLILQIARLISMLQAEVKPILEETRETAETARGTAQFVGRNVVEPVISLQSTVAGIIVLFRELFGIRKAIRRSKQETANES